LKTTTPEKLGKDGDRADLLTTHKGCDLPKRQ